MKAKCFSFYSLEEINIKRETDLPIFSLFIGRLHPMVLRAYSCLYSQRSLLMELRESENQWKIEIDLGSMTCKGNSLYYLLPTYATFQCNISLLETQGITLQKFGVLLKLSEIWKSVTQVLSMPPHSSPAV